MIDKNTLIVGIAIIGALALLTETVIPVALAITNPNQRSTSHSIASGFGTEAENAGVIGKDNDAKGFSTQSNCFFSTPC